MGIYFHGKSLVTHRSTLPGIRKKAYLDFRQLILELKEEGMTTHQVCLFAGINFNTYKKWRLGETLPCPGTLKKLRKAVSEKQSILEKHRYALRADEVVSQIIRHIHNTGKSRRDIAKSINCSTAALCRWVRKDQLPDKISIAKLEVYLKEN